ncbi:HAMP domain-containing sensor histidine kinase [Paenibacillus sp. LHD-117]|uniref:HAMP domain-containing sensor histidine kinase n=1 Tax=Paenibacillus sp. LHD-117 TaxID=3071412 RepID=UPI0027E0D552|nr:HAMP domain-containing sensor histidine kinase [Paenibacillus sp. LHD-117]MDQ6419159.1 HAMP domain-containing sensor histidine kinase [Paenibacillus sp. LHD-117]
MSIRLKLYMSYLAMAIVPFILLILFIMLIVLGSGEQDIRELTKAKQNENFNQALVYGELTYVLREDAGQMQNPAFLSDLQERLSKQWAGLIISKDGTVSEVSPFLSSLAPDENWQLLTEFPREKLYFQSYRFTTHQLRFQYPDGGEGTVLLLYRTEQIPFFWHPLTMILSLLSILLTSLLLTYFVSRSIIKPLQSLRTAALQIKEGDLSQPMALQKKYCKPKLGRSNEVVQLGAAFEEMRVRLKHSIDQSLQYEENRKLLLSHISHDLKTPISAIKGYVEGIMDGIANTDEKRDRYMGTIYRKASEMDHLIDELFLFSKLDLQKVAYDFKVVDIVRYVDDYMEEQRFDLEKSGIKLVVKNEEEAAGIQVAADPDKLNRVFANILSNGIKYMNQEPEQSDNRITVTVSGVGGDAIICFEDTGPGIDEADLPHIFDGFYRAEQSRNSETGGSGLGLAIVKQIVEGHGGSVWAENAQEGGARFCLRLQAIKAVNET